MLAISIVFHGRCAQNQVFVSLCAWLVFVFGALELCTNCNDVACFLAKRPVAKSPFVAPNGIHKYCVFSRSWCVLKGTLSSSNSGLVWERCQLPKVRKVVFVAKYTPKVTNFLCSHLRRSRFHCTVRNAQAEAIFMCNWQRLCAQTNFPTPLLGREIDL